jgi:xanthine dehydrogenase YagS FAD-binding subunit
MKGFEYIKIHSVEEAVPVLEKGRAEVFAGGIDLMGRLKTMMSPNVPEVLIDIKSIAGMHELKEEGGFLRIGPLVTLAEIAESPLIKEQYATLAEASRTAATPELRNMGTIGGNICQFVRCWYYRAEHNAFNCLRKDSSGICYALKGDNRYHSIFGDIEGCMAVNPGNIAPVLIALNASIKTSKRTVDAENFFTINGEKTTSLDDNELISEIQVPKSDTNTRSSFLKFALRKAFGFAIVSCSAVITSDAGTVSAARICLNAVYNTPYRASAAEEAIVGKAIDEVNAEAAGEVTVSSAMALSMNKYKIQIAKTLVKRAILACK